MSLHHAAAISLSPCLLNVDASKVYDPGIDGLNGCQDRVRRFILPRSTTWIYFYGEPPANIGHVAQLRFAVLLRLRSGCGGCVPVLTFASHARACFYRVMLSTHDSNFPRFSGCWAAAGGGLLVTKQVWYVARQGTDDACFETAIFS